MKRIYDLSELDWQLTGWSPELWRMQGNADLSKSQVAESRAVAGKVPGSVQYALREAGILPDWNVGLQFRECDWVENRQWIYEAAIPDELIEAGKTIRLNCRGLDYAGWVYVNGALAGEFVGSFTPYVFDLTPYLAESHNVLRVVFEIAPRYLGQFTWTSRLREWKPRFNYSWDWTPRLVQIGFWDRVLLEVTDKTEFESFRCTTDVDVVSSVGSVALRGRVSGGGVVRLNLSRQGKTVAERNVCADEFNAVGVELVDLPVELWWPNLEGDQPVYDLKAELVGADDMVQDTITRRVGFREVYWDPCEGAPPEADPWICVVNGRRIFLQGVDWAPILPNFADVTEADYIKRLKLYKELGANILRVWGGAVLEREMFYNLCDELGIFVWQEFPLSSSGMDCVPPEDEQIIGEVAEIARTYIARRAHHPSLLLWCGGNELIAVDPRVPLDAKHPMLARLKAVVEEEDPTRRFLPTSPLGPSVHANLETIGKGVHWDVHGPWNCVGDLDKDWTDYWSRDDALFRAETGSPGACSAEIIRQYAGDLDVMPASVENPLWTRHSVWWIDWHEVVRELGREPATLEEYVELSQARQAKALSIAVGACKRRFPRCGGIMLWMGHDCYPCTGNTAIIDFHGEPKPAALALSKIWKSIDD